MSPRGQYLLVIQVPIGTMGDFDRLVEAEQRMEALLGALGQVDGHDSGSGEANLFIFTDQPALAFQKALPCLDEASRDLAKAAYREVEGKDFTLLWPPGAKEFRIL